MRNPCSRAHPVLISAVLIASLAALTVSPAADGNANWRTWGDQGDGTYRNPILAGDFSDPDAIRVGDDYYLIVSTFQYSPGMAVLHSRDLVNWRYLSHCVPDLALLGPELNWDRMNRYNRGIYAGALRHHDGKFWMFFTTLDEGFFVTTAENPAGPWSPPHRLWDAKGWDDPCPFWDDDGQAWLLASKPGKTWFTYLFKMAPDGRSLDTTSQTIIDDHHGSEGNKLYKIDGTYFLFHNQIDGPANRTGVMMRSKNLCGPWEKKLILQGPPHHRDREPNQGALIQTPAGAWWFLTHHGRGGFFDGRPLSVLPVQWINGWPIPGHIDEAGVGSMLWSAPLPTAGHRSFRLQTDDEFSNDALGPHWEWNHQPRREKWSLTERPGWLRLKAFPPAKPDRGFFSAGNTLTQRVLGYGGGEVTTRLDVHGFAEGQRAGLAFYWKQLGALGVVQHEGTRRIELTLDGALTAGPALSAETTEVWLKAAIDDTGGCIFAYSLDGTTFTSIGGRFAFGWHAYRGTRLALYSYNDSAEAGFADFDSFHYRYAQP